MAREFAKSFYNSKEWQMTRDHVLMRDHYLCVRCGRPATEVHHIVHLSPANIGDPKITMNPNNLISVCRDCHFNEHKLDKLHGAQAKREAKDEYEFDENGFLVRKNQGTAPVTGKSL